MILADELRLAVLQAAMEGRLTKQEKQDSNVDKLLADIYTKKQKTIKGQTDVDLSEVPFEIPENWRWEKVGRILDIKGGKRIPKGMGFSAEPTSHIYIRVTDMQNKTIMENDIHYVSDSVYENIKNYTISKDDLYIVIVGSTIGKVGNVPDRFDNMLLTENAAKLIIYNMNKDYLLYMLSSSCLQSQFADKTKQVGVPKLAMARLANTYIPIPPIEEQQRIVCKLNSILKEIDSYSRYEDKLYELKKDFPEDMKRAVVQYAMQGKLTKQEATDSSVDLFLDKAKKDRLEKQKCGKLSNKKTITPIEEELFDIPESWRWVRFGEIVDFKLGKTPSRTEPKYWGRDYNWVSISDMVSDSIVEKTNEGISECGFNECFSGEISPKGTLIMSFKLTLGRVSILGIDALHNEAIISIFPFADPDNILQKYLIKILPYITKYGDSKNAIKGATLNSTSLNDLLIPLPPSEEQQRIIEKLNEILPLCDDLKI
jgi:type I restriction enzyme S subunit